MGRSTRHNARGRAPAAVRGGIARDSPSVLFGGARRRRRRRPRLALALLLACIALAAAGAIALAPAPAREPPPAGRIGPAPPPPTDDGRGEEPVAYPAIEWRESRAAGLPFRGHLVRGVQLPAAGPDWFTWDPVRERKPDRGWRRWGTAALLRTTLAVLRQYRAEDPDAPRVGIEDLSRQKGGWFGREYGGLGHQSHQNGLDVDVLYPRTDERERRGHKVSLVDRKRSQALLDLFVEAGADKIFVGPHLALRGPRRVVIPLVYHDDHMHVRIPRPPE